MKIAGIICEYNPLHEGHARHMAVTREQTHADFIVCVMSGAFVQRGGPAIIDKWTRAHMALLCGADAVFELPALFATRSARDFARGGVGLLAGLGADILSFGCETDNLAALRARADAAEDALRIRAALQTGVSYPRAVAMAADGAADLLSQPNATLAIEYLRQIERVGGRMAPFAVKRDSAHHSPELDEGVSGSAMRKAMLGGDARRAAGHAPQAVRQLMLDAVYNQFENMAALALHAIRTAAPESLRQLADMSEGLENRLQSAANKAVTLEEMLNLAKCKRYPMARLRRAVAHCLLGITKQACAHTPRPAYARLLGSRADAGRLMRELKERAVLPIITRAAKAKDAPGLGFDILAQDIFDLAIGQKPGRDYTTRPLLV